MNTTSPPADDPQPASSDAQHLEATTSDFASTLPAEAGDSQAGWWPESTDGRCSEHAALFAASQPAPLSVV